MDFLIALGMTKDTIKKRVSVYNVMAAEHDFEADALFQQTMAHKSGLPPWYGNRSSLRVLHRVLTSRGKQQY